MIDEMRVSRCVTIHSEVPGLGEVRVLLEETGARASLVLTCNGSPLTLRVSGPNAHAVVELGMTTIRVATGTAKPWTTNSRS